MKNRLTDLNDHLFAQMERLSAEDISSEGLEKEIARGAAMVGVAEQIIRGGELQLKAVQAIALHGEKARASLPMVGVSKSPAHDQIAPKDAGPRDAGPKDASQ